MLTMAQQIAALDRLSVKDLRVRYAEAFGEETNGRNKVWLVKRIAWKLQANAEGGLSERARQRATELAATSEIRTTIPAPRRKATAADTEPPVAAEPEVATLPFPSDRRLPPPGSYITRTYKGDTLRVRVLAQGFEYGGEIYPSLSAVAKVITGSHCNGFLFFKLTANGGQR